MKSAAREKMGEDALSLVFFILDLQTTSRLGSGLFSIHFGSRYSGCFLFEGFKKEEGIGDVLASCSTFKPKAEKMPFLSLLPFFTLLYFFLSKSQTHSPPPSIFFYNGYR